MRAPVVSDHLRLPGPPMSVSSLCSAGTQGSAADVLPGLANQVVLYVLLVAPKQSFVGVVIGGSHIFGQLCGDIYHHVHPGPPKGQPCDVCRRPRNHPNTMLRGKLSPGVFLPFRSARHNICIPCRNYCGLMVRDTKEVSVANQASEKTMQDYMGCLEKCPRCQIIREAQGFSLVALPWFGFALLCGALLWFWFSSLCISVPGGSALM